MNSLSNDGNSNNTTSSHWLGFSLSPQMEGSHGHDLHHTQPCSNTSVSSASVPLSFSQTAPSHINYNAAGSYYGGESENAAFYSSLSVMPLKSDGSLCIMEAFNRSHPQGFCSNLNTVLLMSVWMCFCLWNLSSLCFDFYCEGLVAPTPKLEDFFGDAAMGTHHYDRAGGMALSLDSMYYHHQNPDNENTHSQDFLTHLQEKSRHHHQQQHIEAQQFQDFTVALRGPELYQQQQQGKTQCSSLQLPSMEDNQMKNWDSRSYTAGGGHALEQQKMMSCMDGIGAESGAITAMGYGDFHSLSLSMSPGSQSSCVNPTQQHHQIPPTVADCMTMETKKRGLEKVDQKQIVHRKSLDTFGQRTSQYRGVTRLDLSPSLIFPLFYPKASSNSLFSFLF